MFVFLLTKIRTQIFIWNQPPVMCIVYVFTAQSNGVGLNDFPVTSILRFGFDETDQSEAWIL